MLTCSNLIYLGGNMKLFENVWLLIILMTLPLFAFSQEKYDSKPNLIFTGKAVPIAKNTLQIVTSYKNNSRYKMFNPMTNKTEKISDKIALNDANFDLLLRYGFSPKFDFGIEIPFESSHKYSPMGEMKGTGINDVSLLTGFNILNGKNSRNFLKNNFRISFPSGSYDNLKSNEIPLGLGCFSVTDEISGFHQFERNNLMYSVRYTYRNENSSNSVDIGDEVGGEVVFTKNIANELGKFGIKSGLNSYYKFDDELNGVSLPNQEKFVTSISEASAPEASIKGGKAFSGASEPQNMSILLAISISFLVI